MGLKFLCHHCEYPIHVKDFLAGKRGKCPQCGGSIRIPANGEERSLPIVSESKSAENESSAATLRTPVPASGSNSWNSSVSTSSPTSTVTPDRIEAPTSQIPHVISEAPNAAWYVRPPSGGQYGPAIGMVFWEWLNEKRVGENSLVWREGWGTWQTAKDTFPEFFGTQALLPHTTRPQATHTQPDARPESSPSASSGDVNASKAPMPPGGSTSELPVASTPVVRDALGVDSTAQSRRSVTMRRKKKQSQNLVLLVSLAVVAVVLVVALILVLVWQNSSK